MNAIKRTLRDIFQYPSAAVGASIILLLVVLAVVIVIAFPYQKAVDLWRAGESAWYKSPKTAQPKWVNWFRSRDLPETLFLSTLDGTATKTVKPVTEDLTQVFISFPIDYQYDYFPQELSVYFKSNFKEKKPLVTLTWVSPNGEELQMANFSIRAAETYRASQDEKLTRKLNKLPPQQALFVDLNSAVLSPVKGPYELRITGNLFEADATLDAEMVLYGQVDGWAGTDHLRRDLGIALLWGLPGGAVFWLACRPGHLGHDHDHRRASASGSAAGWIELIQRITEVNLVLPFLPILIMIGTFYTAVCGSSWGRRLP